VVDVRGMAGTSRPAPVVRAREHARQSEQRGPSQTAHTSCLLHSSVVRASPGARKGVGTPEGGPGFRTRLRCAYRREVALDRLSHGAWLRLRAPSHQRVV
jgi:hypothetical protein